MVADELDECGWVRLPVVGKPFELLKNCVNAGSLEQLNRVLRVLVEIRIENSLVHEVLVLTDVKEHPPKVVELQRRERVRARRDRFLDALPVAPDLGFG